jgi:hypothetical protein
MWILRNSLQKMKVTGTVLYNTKSKANKHEILIPRSYCHHGFKCSPKLSQIQGGATRNG